MKKWFCFLMSSLFLWGCDSPIQHKVKLDSGDCNAISAASIPSKAYSNLSVSVNWLKGPSTSPKQTNNLMVFLYKDGELYSLPQGFSLNFYSTMPDMGHPMVDAGYFEEIDTGIYVNKSIVFNMGGDWLHELWVMDENDSKKDIFQWSEQL